MSPTERLAEQVWRWIDGDTAAVVAWLEGFGMTVRTMGDGSWAIDGLCGVTVGLMFPPPDPLSVAIPLGFAFFGAWWPQVVPGLLTDVNCEWARRRRARKEAP